MWPRASTTWLCCSGLGWALAEAKPYFERALKLREKALGSEHPSVANSLGNLGAVLKDQGAYDKARQLYERALQIYEKALGPEHPRVAASLHHLALLLHVQGQTDRAGAYDGESPSDRGGSCAQEPGRSDAAPAHGARAFAARPTSMIGCALAPHLGRSGYEAVLHSKGSLARVVAAERRVARSENAEVLASVAALRAAEGRLAGLANADPYAALQKRGSRHMMNRAARQKAKAAWQQAYAQAGAEREELALKLQRDRRAAAGRAGAPGPRARGHPGTTYGERGSAGLPAFRRSLLRVDRPPRRQAGAHRPG